MICAKKSDILHQTAQVIIRIVTILLFFWNAAQYQMNYENIGHIPYNKQNIGLFISLEY